MTDSSRCFIVVTGPQNWAKTAALGWQLLGLKSTRRRMALGLRPGDRIIGYYTGVKQFGVALRVEAEPFEDHAPIWSSPNKPGEDYPYRVRTSLIAAAPDEQLVDAAVLAPRLQYTQKWPVKNWTLAFQGNIHEIPAGDYDLIVSELRAAGAARLEQIAAD